jgi:hypothetical protein
MAGYFERSDTFRTALVYVIQVCRQLSSSRLILLERCLQTCMTYTIAECTVRNSWWWTTELSETCRVSFQNKKFEKISASGWFYYRGPQWLGYECHLNRANVFQREINAAWPLRGEPSSDHTVPTAAMYSVRGSARSGLVHTPHSGGCNLYKLNEPDMLSFLIFVQCVSVCKQTQQYKFEQCLWHDQHLCVSTQRFGDWNHLRLQVEKSEKTGNHFKRKQFPVQVTATGPAACTIWYLEGCLGSKWIALTQKLV